MGQFGYGAIASLTALATATAPGVSECRQTQSAIIGMSLPSIVLTFFSAIARTVLLAAASGSQAACSRVMISLPFRS
jgi:hypothetical protein